MRPVHVPLHSEGGGEHVYAARGLACRYEPVGAYAQLIACRAQLDEALYNLRLQGTAVHLLQIEVAELRKRLEGKQ